MHFNYETKWISNAQSDILIVLFPILHSSYATFGLVSVVIIALAALNHTNLFCSIFNISSVDFEKKIRQAKQYSNYKPSLFLKGIEFEI